MASMMGWDKGAQNILKFTNRDGGQISLIAEYSQNDAETLKTARKTFIKGINSDKQAAQTNVLLSVQQPHRRGQNNDPYL